MECPTRRLRLGTCREAAGRETEQAGWDSAVVAATTVATVVVAGMGHHPALVGGRGSQAGATAGQTVQQPP